MSNEIAKSETQLDGFEGYSERVEGSDAQPQGLVGLKKLKFLNGAWTDPDENEFKRLLVANDIRRRVLKWLEGSTAPVETITLAPGQPWPDIEKMNGECPRSEWREIFGRVQGPWQGEHAVTFFDPDTMVCYWWPSPI